MENSICPSLRVLASLVISSLPTFAWAVGGTLALSVQDESTSEPTITRMELWRATKPGTSMPIRKTVPAGVGVVLDRSVDLELPESAYQFRMIRGPEYRIVSGNFSLEKTSLDQHSVQLPRMIDMLAKGWTSGDCGAPTSAYSFPLRMAAEDLHVAAVLGHTEARPIAGRDRDDPIGHEPIWIREDVVHEGGLLFYGMERSTENDAASALPVERLAAALGNESVQVAIENPFAWPLPVWLSSNRVDGVFILGDWLRLDRKVPSVKNGRPPDGPDLGDGKTVGRWAEQIYWNMLEAGFRIPPLAGSGNQGRNTPLGYNRLYVANPLDNYEHSNELEVSPVKTAEQWWGAAWRGQSVATNGPLLRPRLGGEIPGHVFRATESEVLQLQPELSLSVRDGVDYLQVIRNGQVFYNARLDEFAKAGGVMPPMMVKESSWVTFRVVTLYEDHFRAAMTAPWYIEFDAQPRVTKRSVDFFRGWLAEYEERLKKLPADELRQHIPFVRASRNFWAERAEMATR